MPLTPETLSFTWSGWANVTVFNETTNSVSRGWGQSHSYAGVWSRSPLPSHLPSVPSPFPLYSSLCRPMFLALLPNSCQSLPVLHVPNSDRIPQCKLVELKLKVTWWTEVTQALSCNKHMKLYIKCEFRSFIHSWVQKEGQSTGTVNKEGCLSVSRNDGQKLML